MNIAILIDCWKVEPTPSFVERILNRAVSKVFPYIKVHWRIKEFLNSRKDISTMIIASYDGNETDPLILKIPKSQLKMLKIEDLEIFLKNNQVENIFMCGNAWDECVKKRPLGYLNVYKLIKKLDLKTDILVKYDCVKNLDDTFFDLKDNEDWCVTNEPDIFIYKP